MIEDSGESENGFVMPPFCTTNNQVMKQKRLWYERIHSDFDIKLSISSNLPCSVYQIYLFKNMESYILEYIQDNIQVVTLEDITLMSFDLTKHIHIKLRMRLFL